MKLITEEKPEFKLQDVKVTEIKIEVDGCYPNKAFVESIKEVGIISPPVLIYSDGHYIVADGRRRIRAAKELGIEIIRCYVSDKENTALKDVMTVHANIHRSRNIVSEYKAVADLIERGIEPEQLSDEIGIPKQKIRKLLNLQNLSPDLFAYFETGRIKPTVAFAISKMDKKYQQMLLERFEIADKITMTDVKAVKRVQRSQETENIEGVLNIIDKDIETGRAITLLANVKEILAKHHPTLNMDEIEVLTKRIEKL